MNKIKLFIFIISFGLVSSIAYTEDGEEEAKGPREPPADQIQWRPADAEAAQPRRRGAPRHRRGTQAPRT